MGPVLSRLKALGLTKAEAQMVINLGIGLNSSTQSPNTNREATDDAQVDVPMELNGATENSDNVDDMSEQMAAENESERDDSLVLSAVIEELDTRFSAEQQQELLAILREFVVNGDEGQKDESGDGAVETAGG